MYNGYTNYETWSVSLWIDNDEGTYNYIQDSLTDIYNNAESSEYLNKDQSAIKEMESFLENWVEENNPIQDASMYSDLLGAAISSVNFYEIAENWLETIKENLPDESDEESEINS